MHRTISDVEIGIYYHLHAEQFHLPERREVCHIFISINPDYPENTYEMALKRAQELAEKLHKKPHKFAESGLKDILNALPLCKAAFWVRWRAARFILNWMRCCSS